jgi:ribosomal protein L16/L10AE
VSGASSEKGETCPRRRREEFTCAKAGREKTRTRRITVGVRLKHLFINLTPEILLCEHPKESRAGQGKEFAVSVLA